MQYPPVKCGEKRPMNDHCDAWVNEVDDGYVLVVENRHETVPHAVFFDFTESINLALNLPEQFGERIHLSDEKVCELSLQPKEVLNVCHMTIEDFMEEIFDLAYNVKCVESEVSKHKVLNKNAEVKPTTSSPNSTPSKRHPLSGDVKCAGESRAIDDNCIVWINDVDDGYVLVGENRSSMIYHLEFNFEKSFNMMLFVNRTQGVSQSGAFKCLAPIRANSRINICHLEGVAGAEFFNMDYTVSVKKSKNSHFDKEPEKVGEKREVNGDVDLWMDYDEHGVSVMGNNKNQTSPFFLEFDWIDSENLQMLPNVAQQVRTRGRHFCFVELKPKTMMHICRLQKFESAESFELKYDVGCQHMCDNCGKRLAWNEEKQAPEQCHSECPHCYKLFPCHDLAQHAVNCCPVSCVKCGEIMSFLDWHSHVCKLPDPVAGEDAAETKKPETPPPVVDDGKVACPECGMRMPPSKLKSHKCPDVRCPDCSATMTYADWKKGGHVCKKKKVACMECGELCYGLSTHVCKPKPSVLGDKNTNTAHKKQDDDVKEKNSTPTLPADGTSTPPPMGKGSRLKTITFDLKGLDEPLDAQGDGDLAFYNVDHGQWGVSKPQYYVFSKKELKERLKGATTLELEIGTSGVPAKSKKGFVTGNDNLPITGDYIKAVIH